MNTPPECPRCGWGASCRTNCAASSCAAWRSAPSPVSTSTRELRIALELCADAGKWTEEEAERWWEQNGASLEATVVRHTPQDLTGTQTVVTNSLGRVAA